MGGYLGDANLCAPGLGVHRKADNGEAFVWREEERKAEKGQCEWEACMKRREEEGGRGRLSWNINLAGRGQVAFTSPGV